MADESREASAVGDRSVAELLKQASDQTVTLVRQEIDLAKAELTVKGKRVGLGAGMFGAAGVFGLYAVGALTAAVILALSLAVTGWLAAFDRRGGVWRDRGRAGARGQKQSPGGNPAVAGAGRAKRQG